jgi:hypothetical protein
MLAGMSPPFNHFEMASLRDHALTELGVDAISRSEALRIYAAEIAGDAVSGRAGLGATLRELQRLCIAEDYAPELYDFYLLSFAWEDLATSEHQWYWPEATRANIATIVQEALSNFVTEARAAGLLDPS